MENSVLDGINSVTNKIGRIQVELTLFEFSPSSKSCTLTKFSCAACDHFRIDHSNKY